MFNRNKVMFSVILNNMEETKPLLCCPSEDKKLHVFEEAEQKTALLSCPLKQAVDLNVINVYSAWLMSMTVLIYTEIITDYLL